MKKSLTTSLVLGLVLVLGSSSALSKRPKYKALFNLASDSRYYEYVEYRSPHRFEDTLLVSIIDKRPEQEKIYNEDIQWFYDDIWAMPPAQMLEKIFSRELKSTNMFNSVEVRGGVPSLILELELLSLIGHYGEGRVARGAIKFRSILRSASDKRVIIDRTYEEASSCLVPKFGNAYRYMYLNIGKTFHTLMKEILMDLENALLRETGK